MAMLLANSALGAVVEDGNVHAGQLGQERAYPALVVNHISTVGASLEVNPLTEEALTSRIQVTAFAQTYTQMKTVLNLVRAACGNRSGTLGDINVKFCRISLEGPDLGPADDGVYIRTQDLLVTWIRALS